jgi:drug/metabolite transporter (DMT)-like permease
VGEVNKGLAAAILAPFFIAFSIILVRMAGTMAPPIVIAGLGTLIAVPLLLAVAVVAKSPPRIGMFLHQLRSPFLKVLVTRSLIGQFLIITGFTMTTAVKAVLLLRLEPLFVFGWSMLLQNEKPRPVKLLLLLALVMGSLLVVAPHDHIDGINIGDILVVASLGFFSYSYIPTQQIVAKANPADLNIFSNLIGGAILTILALMLDHWQAFSLSAQAWQLIGGYALVFPVIGASLYFYAFKTLKPWVIASFLSLEVVFGLILAVLILRETIAPLQFLGAVIVLGATAGIGRLNQPQEMPI